MAQKTRVEVSGLEGLERDLRDYAQAVCSYLSSDIANRIEEEYLTMISRFYGELDPHVYIRHADRGQAPGLPLTYRRWRRNNKGKSFEGGIYINTSNMYDDYGSLGGRHVDASAVLESFLGGHDEDSAEASWHGPIGHGTRSSYHILKHMYNFRDEIARNIDLYAPDAIQKARQGTYKYLSF